MLESLSTNDEDDSTTLRDDERERDGSSSADSALGAANGRSDRDGASRDAGDIDSDLGSIGAVDGGQRTLATNVATALAYGKSIVGAPFAPWTGGPLQAGAPMWTASGAAPAPATVKAQSANAAGLVNLMLRAVGKPLPSAPVAGTGGTGAYGVFYEKVAKPFDVNVPYPEGTLIGRKYRDVDDQGHLAVILEDGKVLQSFATTSGATTPGVNTTFTVIQSHAGGYYEYAVMPEDWLAP